MSKSNKTNKAPMHVQKYTAFTDAAALDKAVADVIEASKTLQQRVQDVSVGILLHAYHSGDWRKANTLVHGLGEGVRRDALVDWFTKFGGLTIAEGAKEFTGWSGAEHIEAHIEKAKTNAWWTFRKANPFQGFDLDAAIAQVLKKHERAVKAAAEEAQAGNADAASMIKADAQKVAALQAMLNGAVSVLPAAPTVQ